ncbi:MAG: AraC family transcriptional regulator [Bacteroidota bacterium]
MSKKSLSIPSPILERIQNPQGGSILVRQFSESARNTRAYWHYHPELELVYVNGGNGKRHIGSHLSYFQDGELVLIGSNLPHQGFTNRLSGYKTETVIHFREDFLGSGFFNVPEMKNIQGLIEKSRRGLSFFGRSKNEVGKKIEALPFFDKFEQIVRVLRILRELAANEEYTILNAEGFTIEIAPQDNDRINIVLNHVRENFTKPIALSEMTELISMTEPSFCRYFKKLTGKTFTQFVNEYRLVHASKLLAEKQISISEVCFESGFSNYSHFNKLFKSFTGKSPSEYRSDLKQIY